MIFTDRFIGTHHLKVKRITIKSGLNVVWIPIGGTNINSYRLMVESHIDIFARSSVAEHVRKIYLCLRGQIKFILDLRAKST